MFCQESWKFIGNWTSSIPGLFNCVRYWNILGRPLGTGVLVDVLANLCFVPFALLWIARQYTWLQRL